MRSNIYKVLPKSLFNQIMLVIVIAFSLIIIIGPIYEQLARSRYLSVTDTNEVISRASGIADLIRTATPTDRLLILDTATRAGMNFKLLTNNEALDLTTYSPWRSILGGLLNILFPPDLPQAGLREVLIADRPALAFTLDSQTTLVSLDVPDTFMTMRVVNPLGYFFIALVALLSLFSLFAVRAIIRPLKAISDAVEGDSDNISDQIFPEQGSKEIVGLARALNEMRKRIRLMLEDRTRMLRGVSHDLRTPLTRLRLRTERLPPSIMRESMITDIDQIEKLTNETLEYLRDSSSVEEFQRADVASILQTICAEFYDVGFSVTYEGPDRLAGLCKPSALARAIGNLCDNGVKFAKNVTVSLSATPDGLLMAVCDDGPGLPSYAFERVTEPFYKVDTSRDANARSGFGLGLSIVSDVVRSHNGTLALQNNPSFGLGVYITLPGTFSST